MQWDKLLLLSNAESHFTCSKSVSGTALLKASCRSLQCYFLRQKRMNPEV